MKILEVKNNLVKISYTAQDNLVLSGFVIIEDSNCPYVAQIMSLKADSGLNYAIVKLLFTFNEEGIVKNYNGSVPELNASITRLSSDELLDILPVEEPLKIGKLAQQMFVLNIDYSALEKNLLICSDSVENTDILFSNFAKQITENNHKSVIFDADGTINAENTLVFGRDFKLPLNYDTINFIYENDLNDVEPISKAVIQDIFLEVQEYSKTVLDKFIPFDNFINVVDAQYRETNIPELALLKNRLLKYKEESVFAQSAKDFQIIRSAIRGNLSTLLDISRADDVLRKQIVSYIYDEISAMDLFVYSFLKIDNDSADKRLIRKILSHNKIFTTVSVPHNYKYVYELKDRASNMILFVPQTTQHDFSSYNVFLSKLNSDECVICGKATQNIPLILEVIPLEDLEIAEREAIEEAKAIAERTREAGTQTEPDEFSQETDSYSYESMTEDPVPPAAKNQAVLEEVPQIEQEELIDLPKTDILPEAKSDSQENLKATDEDIDTHTEGNLPPASEDEDEFSEESDQTVADTQDEIHTEEEAVTEEIAEDIQETDENEETVETTGADELETAEQLPEINETVEEPLEDELPEVDEINEETLSEELPDVDVLSEESISEELPKINELNEETISEELTDTDVLNEESISEELPNINELNEETISDELSDSTEINEEALTEEDLPALDMISEEPLSEVELPEIGELSDETISEEELPDIDMINEGTHIDEPLEDNQISETVEQDSVLQDNLLDDTRETISDNDVYDLESALEEIAPEPKEQPPVVPVYPVEETSGNRQDNGVFEAGDRVAHPKYGEGIIEKMIKYGNKMLCSINFENGRRLLDPSISDIRKL